MSLTDIRNFPERVVHSSDFDLVYEVPRLGIPHWFRCGTCGGEEYLWPFLADDGKHYVRLPPDWQCPGCGFVPRDPP